MKTKTQKTFLVVLATFVAICMTFAAALTVRAENVATDPTVEKTYTQAAYSVVADVTTNKRIDVPVKWGEIQDKTDVTATITAKGFDFIQNNGNFYTNDPYIVIRETEDKSFQVWARVTRNGLVQVFTGKIGGAENLALNVNVYAIHASVLSGWDLKIVTTATSAEFFAGNNSCGTATFEATPLAFGIDFCAGFYGYMTDLSLKIGDKEYVDINDETEIEGFTVSNMFIPASGGTVTVPTLIGQGKYIKNVKTGKYEKTSDLEVEIKFTAVDTGETIANWWEVPVIGFYTTENGTNIGVRNGSNGITQIFNGNTEGNAIYSSAYHGYYNTDDAGNKKYDCPYAYGVKVNIKNGKANVSLNNSVYHSDVELGAGKTQLTFANNGATAYCGISVKVKNAADYDFNDVADAQYLSFIDVEPTDGKVGYFTLANGKYSAANGEGGYENQVALSTAFGGENLSATKLNLVMSYTVTMDAKPEGAWQVPGVTFWQGTDGATYNLLAHYNADTYVFKITDNGTTETLAKQFGACALSETKNGTYSVTIKIENGVAKFAVSGHQEFNGEFELPEGRPVMQLFTRGTAATISNVKFYTTDIDFSEDAGLKAYSEAMTVIENPTAEKFGDELVGGKLKVTLSDDTEKEIALTDEGVTVTYNAELLGEQDVVIKYEDATAVFTASVKVNLKDFATRIVLDAEKQEFEYGEDLSGYTVTAIMASGAETDVTTEVALSGYDKNKSGKQTVTFTYGELTVTGEFTVKEKKETPPESSDSGESSTTDKPSDGSSSDNTEKKGCFGGVSALGAIALVAFGGAVMLLRKKKD